MPLIRTTLIPQFFHYIFRRHSSVVQKEDFPYNFFLKYLLLASNNINFQPEVIEASIQFQKDLINKLPYINKIFKCHISKDIVNSNIINFFKYFYNQIDTEIKSMSNELEGDYYIAQANTPRSSLFFNVFKPNKLNNLFLTDSPIAYLFIYISEEYSNYQNENYLNLEIDLLKAAGLTIVLCISIDAEFIDPRKELLSLLDDIKTNFISEIHLIINNKLKEDTYQAFLEKLNEIIPTIDGYFYLYAYYFSKKYVKIYSLLKELGKNYNFMHLHFIFPQIIYTLDCNSLVYQRPCPFVYYETGYETDKIRVFLYDVPLYDQINDVFNFELSGITIGYISRNDFTCYLMKKVHILYDSNSSLQLIDKYVDFNDIHIIRICYDFDINDDGMDNLGKIEQDELYNDDIMSTVTIVFSDQKKATSSCPIFVTKSHYHEKKILKYVGEIYSMNKVLNSDIEKFELSVIQRYVIDDILRTCLKIKKEKGEEKGVVYQIETGDGKSAIAAVTAACLCKFKKTVHIISSNIILAIRDFYESIRFFKLLKLKTAVLLHYNELPFGQSNQSQKDDEFVYEKKFFKKKYFGKKLFENSLNMNISICGIDNKNKTSNNKVNVIFSTMTNFECLYLKIMEEFPLFVKNVFQNTCLIIDEADSILIDELATGTILSHSMESNQDEILKFVYDCWLDKKDPDKVCDKIKKKWPKCKDINKDDIDDMYQQIKLINQDEFVNGKKYSIEQIEIDDNKDNIFKKGIKLMKKVSDGIDNFKEKTINKIVNHITTKKSDNEEEKEYSSNNNDDDDDIANKTNSEISSSDSNDDDENTSDDDIEEDYNDNDNDLNGDNSNIENNITNDKRKVLKEIVPFDYNHKGILEPNKEFSGFIQQFIAIKEMKNSKGKDEIVIKKNSMNYLYVSHPIFVSMYPFVFGFTGTVGNKYDKEVFNKQYQLKVTKLPKKSFDYRVELPIVLCSNIEERNEAIVEEIIHIHSTTNPVLAIFQDLNEISVVEKILQSRGITDINIFDGKSEIHKPEKIAGQKNSITLGTNACGRGTNIHSKYSLHVIVTFYTSNVRVIKQAFGRTARNGNEGTVRIICLLDQFIAPIEIFKRNGMNGILSNFECKNAIQEEFIESFRKNHEWIFSPYVSSQKINKEFLIEMRNSKITVNRLKAVNFEYPICMSISTFLKIQAQKIYSLYNCPNCKYTWGLFQKYVREMILESWALFIDKAEKQYYKKETEIPFREYLQGELVDLYKELNVYFPESNKERDIVSSFIHIFNYVKNMYQKKVLDSFPNGIVEHMKSASKKLYAFSVGFRPYSLVDESGSRIGVIGNRDSSQTFIMDPELKYMRRTPKGLIPISITEKIDSIFNWMCTKIDDEIGNYIGLKFFLRRTLGGCEFGVCFDFDLDDFDDKLKDDLNCFIDKDPLLVFAVNVKSTAPLLAGFLIIWAIYILGLFKSVAEWIAAFSVKFSKQVLKTLKNILLNLSASLIEKCCNNIIELLQRILDEQIKKIMSFDKKLGKTFLTISKIVGKKDFSSLNKIKALFINQCLPTNLLFKIGFLLLMCFASFMIVFKFNHQKVKYNKEKIAMKYDQNQNIDLAIQQNMKCINLNELSHDQ